MTSFLEMSEKMIKELEFYEYLVKRWIPTQSTEMLIEFKLEILRALRKRRDYKKAKEDHRVHRRYF